MDVYHLVAYVFTLSGLPERFEGAFTSNYMNGYGCGLGPLLTTTMLFFHLHATTRVVEEWV